MRCQAKVRKWGRNIERQCRRTACIGIFCSYHGDYVKMLEKEIARIKEEIRRVKKLK